MTNYDTRREALELAIRSTSVTAMYGATPTSGQFVERAEAFLAFLEGTEK